MHSVVLTYNGYDLAKDDMIISSLDRRDRRLFGGSGYDCFDGKRDLGFRTHKKEIAKRLQKNLRKALKKNKIRGKVEIFIDDEQEE